PMPPPQPSPRGREPKLLAASRCPFPRLRGGRDGGRLALAVASPFPCSDAPTPPSPARGGGSQRSRAARSRPFPPLRGREPTRLRRKRPDSFPRLRGKAGMGATWLSPWHHRSRAPMPHPNPPPHAGRELEVGAWTVAALAFRDTRVGTLRGSGRLKRAPCRVVGGRGRSRPAK